MLAASTAMPASIAAWSGGESGMRPGAEIALSAARVAASETCGANCLAFTAASIASVMQLSMAMKSPIANDCARIAPGANHAEVRVAARAITATLAQRES